jgi:hypothetical protein
MTYAAVSDITDNFRKLPITADSDFNIDRVTRFLTQEEAFIDSFLIDIYVFPITGTRSLELLKVIEVALVSAKIASIIDLKQNTQLGTTSNNIKQEFNKREYAETHKRYLNDIKNRTITLPDAPLLNSDYGMSSYTEENDILPEFDKGLQQW